MKQLKRIFILSAELSEQNVSSNAMDMRALWNDIHKLELRAEPAKGYYKGIAENSIIVTENSTDNLKDTILNLAGDHHQDSIFMREPSGACYLVYLDDRRDEYIGEWQQVPEVIAKMRDASTEIDGNYYITHKF